MNWTALNETKILADCPTDLRPLYDSWIAANPTKAGRLAEITAGIIAEFRDAIATNAANRLDADATKIPESCVRSAEVLIYGAIQNEMGNKLSTDDSQAMTRAEILLRQIGYQHFIAGTGAATSEPSPHYETDIQRPERTLP